MYSQFMMHGQKNIKLFIFRFQGKAVVFILRFLCQAAAFVPWSWHHMIW